MRNLAVAFRCNYPNLRHVDTWNAIAKLGGPIAIWYGFWCAQPKRAHKKRQAIAAKIADMIEEKIV